jgi:hypothetical protein
VELGRQLVLDVLWDELFGEKKIEVVIWCEGHFFFLLMRWRGKQVNGLLEGVLIYK